ncbi:MAP3K epsilon protein kinase 1 [Dendrobium catenatum]|uniref:MAP3K epsilon protein kinase 1 n=1 Tax=Dendrobium catenatum TaxID=906689 RepID=UPI0009F36D32|nr:MAP3K epsilon protein kinase 1 [Dendrobium catenatum]
MENYGLPISHGPLDLSTYSDADWAGDIETRRSTSGYCSFLGTTPILWTVKKRHTVSISSTEAEYRALAAAITDIIWLRQLLQDFKIQVLHPTDLYCDSTSTIALDNNPVFHAKTKHMEIDHHFIRHHIHSNIIRVQKISTQDQLANILTKPLSTSRYHFLRSKLRVSENPRRLNPLLISHPIKFQVLSALFNLCKINKRRQEQAAENGIIPYLMNFIMSDSSLKHSALPLLCDMAHASRNSREQLRIHGGLDVYLNLLEDEAWAVTALDSIAVCLAHDNDHKKVEQAMLRKEAIQKLVKFFRDCPEQYFVNILEPFLKIITKSARINTAMATSGLATLLISRLDHQDAIARLNLLKLIKAVYEHHPRPKQLIVENDLPQKLQNLIEERRNGQRSGGQVLVKQMATALVKALHINTVL